MIGNVRRTISFDAVRNCYCDSGINHSPLLEPVSTIEERLRPYGYLTIDEHLGEFLTDKEEFTIVVWEDDWTMPEILFRIKLKKLIGRQISSLRLKLAQKILPK